MAMFEDLGACLGTAAATFTAVVQALTLRLFYWMIGGPAGPD